MRKKMQDFFESRMMHWFVGIFTMVNTVVLGMSTTPSLDHEWKVLLEKSHEAILAIFVLEVSLRFLAFGFKFFKSGWNIFDSIIIIGSFLPINGAFSILRSIRILHLFSAVEDMPKTRHIIMGLYRSLPGILNVIFLMVFLFFVSSVLGVFLFQNEQVEHFVSLEVSMHTLFQVLTGDDWHKVMMDVVAVYAKAWIFFYVYYIIMGFLVLNLFIGVIVGALQAAEEEVYKSDEENNLSAKLDKIYKELTALKKAFKKQ